MTATKVDPVVLVGAFAKTVGRFRQERVGDAFDILAKNLIQWHRDLLLSGDEKRLRPLFTQLAGLGKDATTREPAARVIHMLSAFVTDKGDDRAVTGLRDALVPVMVETAATDRNVASAARHGINWADEAWRDGLHHNERRAALQP